MKLGIDLDGVVVDFVGACADILEYYKAEDVKLWDDLFALAELTSKDFFDEVRERNVFERAEAVPGAWNALEELHAIGHEVHFITARPVWAEHLTLDWLGRNCPIPGAVHVLSNGESKSTVSCDLYLDDAPHVLTDLMDNHRRVVRYERPWNQHSKDWDFTVSNWEQFVTLVEDVKHRKQVARPRSILPGAERVAATMAHPLPGPSAPNIIEMSGTGYAKRDVETTVASEGVWCYDDGDRIPPDDDGYPTEEELDRFFEAISDVREPNDAPGDSGFGSLFGLWANGETRIVDAETGGAKGSKPQRMDLLPWDALLEVSAHYGAGAEKYEDRNWERGYAWHLTFAALQRHLAAWWQGEDVDEDGLEHLNAVVFHALTLRTFTLRNIGTDDRPATASDRSLDGLIRPT